MNLSETFVINPEADNPLCALAYSLDALVAHLELIHLHIEDSTITDEILWRSILNDSVFGVLEFSKMCREIGHKVNGEFDDLDHVRIADLSKMASLMLEEQSRIDAGSGSDDHSSSSDKSVNSEENQDG